MGKGGSQAAVAESKKSRKQANAFNQRSLVAAKSQFDKTFRFQQAQAADMARLARVTPSGSDSTRDMASAADEIARAAGKRTSFSKFRFGQ